MAKFRVDSDVLKAKATDVRGIRAEHENVVAKLGTIVNALAEVWEGQAYQKFVSDYESIKPTFTKLAETLEAVAADLDHDAEIYAEAEARAASNTSN